jgi:hypothetical protein
MSFVSFHSIGIHDRPSFTVLAYEGLAVIANFARDFAGFFRHVRLHVVVIHCVLRDRYGAGQECEREAQCD